MTKKKVVSKIKEKKAGELSELEKAQRLISEKNRKELEACQKDISAVLEKHKCQLSVYPNVVIAGNQVTTTITKK